MYNRGVKFLKKNSDTARYDHFSAARHMAWSQTESEEIHRILKNKTQINIMYSKSQLY